MQTARLTNHEILGFNDVAFRAVGVVVLGFVLPLIFFDETLSNGLVAYLPSWIITALYALVYWEGNRFIIIQARRRFPDAQQLKQKLIWQVAAMLIFTLAVCNFVLHPLFGLLGLEANSHQPTSFESNAASLITVALCAAIYESVYFIAKYQKAALETEQLKKENLQSQLETLKNQVNPHFLFNSLNTLSALIHDNPDIAVEFVQKLSKVYRYILEIRDNQTVTLQDELKALHAYIFLLKTRFGRNLHIEVIIPEHLQQHRIVPLSLQILLENAVKHNILSAQKPLYIDIFTETDRHIVVKNNLQRKNQTMPGTQLGLQNISNRYRLLAGTEMEVLITEQSFTVALPLLLPDATQQATFTP
ncbi:MAG TPA: histidine kinase [Chitinophagales bacterium]|nr:histidine kinase [Chitinophagales bacterium]HRK27744.1 histidine kinase [Chitinophagales bacterium]